MTPKRKKPARRPTPSPRDPAPVAEVRAARLKLVADAGGTSAGLVRLVFRDRSKQPRTRNRRSA